MEAKQEIDSSSPRVSIIAALGKNRELGYQGELLWQISADLKRFKELTSGHPVIMGRKTWESLPERYRPLPGRTNIVVTQQGGYSAPGATVVDSLENARAAAARAPGSSEIFIIGGGELYAAALPYATRLYLTLVNASAPADTYFPAYEDQFVLEQSETGAGEPQHRFAYFTRRVII